MKSNLRVFLKNFDSLKNEDKREIIIHMFGYFIDIKGYALALNLLFIEEEIQPKKIVSLLIQANENEDSIEKKRTTKTKILNFLAFVEKNNPEFYAELFFEYRLRYLSNSNCENYSEYCVSINFDKESRNVLFVPWFKIFILNLIKSLKVGGHFIIKDYVFNPEFNQLIIDRVIPELRSVTTHILTIEKGKSKGKIDIYKSDLEIFWYLATLLEYTFKKDDEDYNIFAIEDEMLLTNGNSNSAYQAVCRIRECAIYFHFVNSEQFTKSVPIERIEDLNNFTRYYFEDEKGTDKLQNFVWFQEANGIKEIPFEK